MKGLLFICSTFFSQFCTWHSREWPPHDNIRESVMCGCLMRFHLPCVLVMRQRLCSRNKRGTWCWAFSKCQILCPDTLSSPPLHLPRKVAPPQRLRRPAWAKWEWKDVAERLASAVPTDCVKWNRNKAAQFRSTSCVWACLPIRAKLYHVQMTRRTRTSLVAFYLFLKDGGTQRWFKTERLWWGRSTFSFCILSLPHTLSLPLSLLLLLLLSLWHRSFLPTSKLPFLKSRGLKIRPVVWMRLICI